MSTLNTLGGREQADSGPDHISLAIAGHAARDPWSLSSLDSSPFYKDNAPEALVAAEAHGDAELGTAESVIVALEANDPRVAYEVGVRMVAAAVQRLPRETELYETLASRTAKVYANERRKPDDQSRIRTPDVLNLVNGISAKHNDEQPYPSSLQEAAQFVAQMIGGDIDDDTKRILENAHDLDQIYRQTALSIFEVGKTYIDSGAKHGVLPGQAVSRPILPLHARLMGFETASLHYSNKVDGSDSVAIIGKSTDEAVGVGLPRVYVFSSSVPSDGFNKVISVEAQQTILDFETPVLKEYTPSHAELSEILRCLELSNSTTLSPPTSSQANVYLAPIFETEEEIQAAEARNYQAAANRVIKMGQRHLMMELGPYAIPLPDRPLSTIIPGPSAAFSELSLMWYSQTESEINGNRVLQVKLRRAASGLSDLVGEELYTISRNQIGELEVTVAHYYVDSDGNLLPVEIKEKKELERYLIKSGVPLHADGLFHYALDLRRVTHLKNFVAMASDAAIKKHRYKIECPEDSGFDDVFPEDWLALKDRMDIPDTMPASMMAGSREQILEEISRLDTALSAHNFMAEPDEIPSDIIKAYNERCLMGIKQSKGYADACSWFMAAHDIDDDPRFDTEFGTKVIQVTATYLASCTPRYIRLAADILGKWRFDDPVVCRNQESLIAHAKNLLGLNDGQLTDE